MLAGVGVEDDELLGGNGPIGGVGRYVDGGPGPQGSAGIGRSGDGCHEVVAGQRLTRAFEVEIEVPNGEGALKSGGFAKAAIQTRLDAEAVTVPLKAIATFAGITKLFLIEDGKAKEVQVTLGIQDVDWVEIRTPGMPKGATVVTSGQSALADGTPVTIRHAK